MLKVFWSIVDDVKRKPYDLLDFCRTQFDRDYLEFNVNIHDLEISLQAFINSSFDNIPSTQHALSLLAQFKAILLRESLKEELESKVQVSSAPNSSRAAVPVRRTAMHSPDHAAVCAALMTTAVRCAAAYAPTGHLPALRPGP